MKFYHKDRQNEDEHWHFLRTRINNENVWEKKVCTILMIKSLHQCCLI